MVVTSQLVVVVIVLFTVKVNLRRMNNMNGQKELLVKNAVKREAGYLYFVTKEGHVARTRMRNAKQV